MSRYFINHDKGKSELPKETFNMTEEENLTSIDDQHDRRASKEPVSEVESPNDTDSAEENGMPVTVISASREEKMAWKTLTSKPRPVNNVMQ